VQEKEVMENVIVMPVVKNIKIVVQIMMKNVENQIQNLKIVQQQNIQIVNNKNVVQMV
jgi:hypothetical protein